MNLSSHTFCLFVLDYILPLPSGIFCPYTHCFDFFEKDVTQMKTKQEQCCSPAMCHVQNQKVIHIFNLFFRDPGVSLSGGSQLHHQHKGQELSFVAAHALQGAMEPPVRQCGSQRLDQGLHLY